MAKRKKSDRGSGYKPSMKGDRRGGGDVVDQKKVKAIEEKNMTYTMSGKK